MLQEVEHQDAVLEELERVLKSETLRHSQQHRSLLSYMVQKSIEQRAEELKEYSVGIDALGKPETYNPRRDATVRIQVGRLRARLTEYYLSEGAQDPIVFDVPKGGFKVLFLKRNEAHASGDLPEAAAPVSSKSWRFGLVPWFCMLLSVALAVAFALIAHSATGRAERITRLSTSLWTPELKALWAGFLDDKRPLTLSLGTPLFVNVDGVMVRDATWNIWAPDKLPPKIERIGMGLFMEDVAIKQRAQQERHGFPPKQRSHLG